MTKRTIPHPNAPNDLSDPKAPIAPSQDSSTPLQRRDGPALERLVDIMATLRGPSGCPWDLEQDLMSLRPYLIEEAYEVLEALEDGDVDEHRQELGDLLLQIVFQARLREEEGAFAFADVANAISEKLIRRHPHVFSDGEAKDSGEVVNNWAKIKAEERKAAGVEHPSALAGIPRALPGLVRAERLGDKASAVGFDWPSAADVRQKVREELQELDDALASENSAEVQEELGDLLFSLAQLARKHSIHPEDALRSASNKFERRFKAVETLARKKGFVLDDLDAAALDALWEEVKAGELG